MYDIVIVDTPRVLSDATVTALTTATKVLLLVELTLPFLRGFRRTAEVFDSIGVPRERVEVVLAKHGGTRAAVPLEEARKTVDLTVTHTLPRDDETALAAVNRGVPLSGVKASSPLRKAIVEIAETAQQNGNNEAPKARRKGLLSGLFAS
jgi:Flp pilus assembly CpaE family ATPase